eukprot:6181497-Pleurochrysis_carterae.AAC.1
MALAIAAATTLPGSFPRSRERLTISSGLRSIVLLMRFRVCDGNADLPDIFRRSYVNFVYAVIITDSALCQTAEMVPGVRVELRFT